MTRLTLDILRAARDTVGLPERWMPGDDPVYATLKRQGSGGSFYYSMSCSTYPGAHMRTTGGAIKAAAAHFVHYINADEVASETAIAWQELQARSPSTHQEVMKMFEVAIARGEEEHE